MLFVHSSSSMHQSNIPRPLLTLGNPLVYHRAISNPQSNLERLAIHRKPVRHLIAAETVQDRLVTGFLRRQDFEGDDAAEEGGVEFAVGKVGADAPEDRSVDKLWVNGMGDGLTFDSQLQEHSVAFPSSQTHRRYSCRPSIVPD